ncbi:hypothetical protein [Brachyspira hampsonii]|uniref:Uncharacterized protein n=2 Tax=Brachyspira hampsonii TaxID=1287055 RepID=A0A2U4EZC0_9SPIR|nr:hypothetical protein [Brachyspira hampsonii]EKV57002.1 hypothetical protein A966_08184 [Brachyspira hampsonii 30446]MBW5389714.1 hypothetical protein [Brachyspira hampsonii]OEJ20159.1 hypothetical protein A9495_02240 [Brachyspira hampsonii]
MAVKKTDTKKTSSEAKNTGRISYKELSEELKLKLQQSEEKIAELNKKYKKVVDIQKKKIEDKYKKIIEDLEAKKSIPAKSQSSNAEINKLQKRLEKLEKTNQKLEEEKRKIELKNEELKLKAKEAVKSKTETASKTAKTDREALKEIKALKEQLLESEQEKKELKAKLREAVADLKNAKKNTNKLSKEDKEQYKENLKILKQIEKESKALDKKRELLKKEEEKLKEIRGDIKSSAKDIASTMKKSYVADDDEDEDSNNGDFLSNMNAKTEEGITKLATLLCAAMDDYREQKEKEREEAEKTSEEVSVLSEGEERLNRASEELENLVENRLEDSDSTKDENLNKRPFTIIDKIENSRVEINEGYTPPPGGQSIVASPDSSQQIGQAPQTQQPNITVKVEAPKESAKLAKPESQLKPASETPTMRMKLLDDIDDYEKKLVITYGFDNMPENTYYSKYKRILRNAARISLFGNLQEGLEMFKLIRDQNIPDEYKQMIDKNIQDITYYLRGLHRVRME